MERAQSTIIQVAPQYENEKIREMELFGWSLQSRQEIHQEGDAYGRPSFTGSSYIIKVKVSHYVKLHFVRNVSLPNLPQIREIEDEYSNLAFPPLPSFTVPAIFTAVGAFGVLGGLSSGMGFVIFGYLVWASLGVLWLVIRGNKRTNIKALLEKNATKAQELRNRALSLTDTATVPLEVLRPVRTVSPAPILSTLRSLITSAKPFICPSCSAAHAAGNQWCAMCGGLLAELHNVKADEALQSENLNTAIQQLDACLCSRPKADIEIIASFNLFVAIWNKYKLRQYDGMNIPNDLRLWALRGAKCLDMSINSYHRNKSNGLSDVAKQVFQEAENSVMAVIGVTMIFGKAEDVRLRSEAYSGPLLCLSSSYEQAKASSAQA
jgi:hypothetical protein